MGRTGEFGETPVTQLQAVNLPSNPRVFFTVIFTKPSRNHLLVGDQSPNTVYGELGQLQNVPNQKRGQTSEFLLLPRSTLCFADGGGTRAGLTSETQALQSHQMSKRNSKTARSTLGKIQRSSGASGCTSVHLRARAQMSALRQGPEHLRSTLCLQNQGWFLRHEAQLQ